jgi:cyclic-di-GMP-binding biofilm dispersal mediator protein
MNLNERVVVVSGGSGVLGSLIGQKMAERGAKLVLAGRNEAALREAASRTPGAIVSTFDLTDQKTLSRPIERALQAFGRLDGLVNAAGVVAFGPLETTPETRLHDLIAVNLTGPLLLTQRAIPHLTGGFIVNLTGVVSEQPVGGMVGYSASKAGLSAAGIALMRELRRQKTLVVDVRAPHTETGLASRPIAGSAPRLPRGLAPDLVADVIVGAVEKERRTLSPADFDTSPSGA